MRINAQFTLLIDRGGLTVEITDHDSGITFVHAQLSPEATLAALGRLAYVDCPDCEVRGLEHVGMVREIKEIDFPFPHSGYGHNPEARQRMRADAQQWAQQFADQTLPGQGWTARGSFDSRDSFRRDKAGEERARTTLDRWLPLTQEQRDARAEREAL